MGCCGDNGYDNNYHEHDHEGECAAFFPDDIKGLLKKLACEHVVLTFRNNCNKERVRIERVSGDLLVVREDGNFRFINIDCICSVAVRCETILESVIKPFGNCHN